MAAALAALLLLGPGVDAVDFGKSVQQRVKLLRHGNAGVRRRAARLLMYAPADRAIAGLLVALYDPVNGVRQAAAASLAALGDERAVPFLARRLREERSPRVLATLLLALGSCADRYAARRVVPFLDYPDRDVRAAAAAALGRLGDATHRRRLWAALRFAPDDPGFSVRSSVLAAFVSLGWKEDVRKAIEELEAAGAHRHWLARATIVSAVGEAGIEERADWVETVFTSDRDPRVVAAAAGALARLGRREAVAGALEHPSPAVRRAALVALQEAGDPRAVERARVLVREDSDPAVRFEAALVLHHAGHPDADLYLVDALRSRNALFWMTALGTLERKYGRSFGRDPEAWAEFLKEHRDSGGRG